MTKNFIWVLRRTDDWQIYLPSWWIRKWLYFSSRKIFTKPGPKTAQPAGSQLCTGVPLEQIDLLECCPKEIDFRIIVKLLDFYQIRLNLGRDFFLICRKTVWKVFSALTAAADAAVLSRPEPLFPRLCSAGNPANKKTAGRKICPRRFDNGYSAMSNLSGVTSAKLWSWSWYMTSTRKTISMNRRQRQSAVVWHQFLQLQCRNRRKSEDCWRELFELRLLPIRFETLCEIDFQTVLPQTNSVNHNMTGFVRVSLWGEASCASAHDGQ